jgi:hypothetical protein
VSWIAELHASAARRVERRLGAGGDGFALVFSDDGHDANGHPIRVG